MAAKEDYARGIEAAIIAAGQIQTRARAVCILAEDSHNASALKLAQSAAEAAELSIRNLQSAILFIDEMDKTAHLSRQGSASLESSEAELAKAEQALGLIG
jgi:hypothetical protein